MAESEMIEPAALCCPVTQVMYRDPVFVPESGNTYERAAIETFWTAQTRAGAGLPRDPLTNSELTTTKVYPNWDKRREVSAWLQEHPEYTPAGWPSREQPPPASPSELSGAGFGGRHFHIELNFNLHLLTARQACIAVVILGSLLVGSSLHELAYMQRGPGEITALASEAVRAAGNGAFSHVQGIGKRPRLRASPVGSRVKVAVQPGGGGVAASLVVLVPERPAHELHIFEAAAALFVLGFVAMWTFTASGANAPLLFVLFSAPFWYAAGIMWRGVFIPHIEESALVLDAHHVHLASKLSLPIIGSFSKSHNIAWPDLVDLNVKTKVVVNGNPTCVLQLQEGVIAHEFGESLSTLELDFIHRQLVQFLDARSQEGDRGFGRDMENAKAFRIDPAVLLKLRGAESDRGGGTAGAVGRGDSGKGLHENRLRNDW